MSRQLIGLIAFFAVFVVWLTTADIKTQERFRERCLEAGGNHVDRYSGDYQCWNAETNTRIFLGEWDD